MSNQLTGEESALDLGRRAFIASATVSLSVLIAGCTPLVGGGGVGRQSGSVEGPSDAREVLDAAQLSDAPEGTAPEMVEATVPEGYHWGREVRFQAASSAVDEWLTASFGSADAAERVHALNPSVAEAFGVEDVPDTWRSLNRSVDGTMLDLMLLIDDLDPTTVRLHLRERAD